MIFLFDIGNTNIVIGIVNEGKINYTYRLLTNAQMTEDEYFQKINNFIIHGHYENTEVEGCIISSVVPALEHIFINMINKYYQIEPKIVGPGMKSGIKIKLENPKQLGADLLCDAVGAYEKYNGPLIIVDLGTATKLLVISGKGEFLGGAIAPGIQGSLENLVSSTAKLFHVSLNKPSSVIGNDTTTCIQSGLIYGHASMVDGMINKIKKELNLSGIKVIMTGGYAPIIKDLVSFPYIFEPNLILDGLLSIYNKNK